MQIKVSIVVCTYNRPDYVSRAIESLAYQTLDRNLYEILVVDNGNDRSARSSVEMMRKVFPNLYYHYSSEPGLSIARNLGIRHATGEYIAFLDDDAVACREWLAAIVASFESSEPAPAIVCGPVAPIWESPRPAWLKDQSLGIYSVLNWSSSSRPLKPAEWVVGANFAVRKDILDTHGPFDTHLGRKGSSLLSGEETALCHRIRSVGHYIQYDPAVAVQHHIHKERLTKKWFYRRQFWGEASKGCMERTRDGARVSSSQYVYTVLKRIVRRLFRDIWPLRRSDGRFNWNVGMARDFGRLYGYLFVGRSS
jgi:glycosyltransferase involved in cell wall biosynthesis